MTEATDSDPAQEPRATRWIARLGLACSVVALAAAALFWWGTATSTSASRLASLQCIEPMAMAVQEQLLFNYSANGEWSQTIQRGYDDAWTWSGHRAPTLWLVSWIYGLAPGAVWLAKIQMLTVLLGAIPAALIGRDALRSTWGLAIGGLIYLSYPPTMALALQDYQDLVFALPCLTFAIWAFRTGKLHWVVLGGIVGLLPREETIALTMGAAALAVPWRRAFPYFHWTRWLRNLGVVAAVAGIYVLWLGQYHPVVAAQHSVPLLNQLQSLIQDGFQVAATRDARMDPNFYMLMFSPAAHPLLLAPLTALPGLAVVAFHTTVEPGMGVDRTWLGHVHHLAPAAPFLIAGVVLGTCRGLRLLARIPRLGRLIGVAMVAGLGAWTVEFDRAWAAHYNLIPAWQTQPPPWTHPLWGLAAQLPADARPIGPARGALVLSNRAVSYSYDISLGHRAREAGFGAGTHALLDTRHEVVLARVMAMAGATVLAESGPFQLLTWDAGATDLQGHIWLASEGGPPKGSWSGEVYKIPKVPRFLGTYNRRDLIPGVPHAPRSVDADRRRPTESP